MSGLNLNWTVSQINLYIAMNICLGEPFVPTEAARIAMNISLEVPVALSLGPLHVRMNSLCRKKNVYVMTQGSYYYPMSVSGAAKSSLQVPNALYTAPRVVSMVGTSTLNIYSAFLANINMMEVFIALNSKFCSAKRTTNL